MRTGAPREKKGKQYTIDELIMIVQLSSLGRLPAAQEEIVRILENYRQKIISENNGKPIDK